MSKMLGAERVGDRTHYYWLHVGDDGKDRISVQTVQDAEPIINAVARRRDLPVDSKSPFRFKAEIPATVVEEVSRMKATEWGLRPVDAYREITEMKTDRAQAVWRVLTEGRDYGRFQTVAR